MELAVAKKLKGVVMTASEPTHRDEAAMDGAPGRVLAVLSPTPEAASASQRASVPLAHPMAWRAAQAAAAAFSNAATWGPRIKRCESQTAVRAERTSCRSEVYWRLKSSMGTGCGLRVGTDCHGTTQDG